VTQGHQARSEPFLWIIEHLPGNSEIVQSLAEM